MFAPLDLVRPVLGISETHHGGVLFARGNGCRSLDHYCEEDTHGAITLHKTRPRLSL